MASVRKQDRGSFIAQWWRKDGTRKQIATGQYEFEAAQKKANCLEARSRFWEECEDGTWQAYANMGFSPKYCHDSFSHAKHLHLDQFKIMLKEAGVKFKPPGRWRDKPKPKAGGKCYLYRNKRLTLAEIIEVSGASIKESALRWRLDRGWGIEDAVGTPVLSRSEAGSMGAKKTNAKRGRGTSR